jgi:outer membrane protein assembly factor BamB
VSRRCALIAVVGLIWATLGAPLVISQSDPFAGWDELQDDDYRFDADEQTLLGFSVRAPIDARSALEAAERALNQGDTLKGAAQLLAVVRKHGAHVVKVAEGENQWNSRWVGAGEWALYQLLTRVPESLRDEIISKDEQAELALAQAWHDGEALARLALAHEGLPTVFLALENLARLQSEEGHFSAARATLDRLRRLGAEDRAEGLARALPAVPSSNREPLALTGGVELTSSWQSGAAGEHGDATVIERLTRNDMDWINPLTGSGGVFEAPYAAVSPLIEGGAVYVTDTLSIWADDLLSGRRLWHYKGPLEVIDGEYPDTESFALRFYANRMRPKAISPHQLAQPLIVGQRLFATVQVAEPVHALDSFDGYPINHPLPWRRLRALDRVTGEVLWSQERPSLPRDSFVNRFDVDGPVVADGRAIFAAGSVTEGSINAYLAAFDQSTGELLWRTPICSGQQELTMFNRPFQEHVISPPTLHEGSLYVCTNLGVVASVDAWSGRVRWLAAYEPIERQSSRMIRPQNSRNVYWLNQAPLVIDDTLIVAPLDSSLLECFDRRTGRRRFDLSSQMSAALRPPLRHQVVDAGHGRFAVLNDKTVECFHATTGRLEWISQPFGPYEELSGAALVDGDRLLVLAEPKLFSLDLADGSMVASYELPLTPRGRQIQRVVPQGPHLLLSDGAEVFASSDHEAVRRSAVARLGHDPRAALELGELALAEQDDLAAAAHFQGVLGNGAPREIETRARSGLLEAALRSAVVRDSPAEWLRVLEVAGEPQMQFAHAERVLAALLRLGAERDVAHWLGVLADVAPQRMLHLDDDGSLPTALHYTLKRLPFEEPNLQLELLQELVRSDATVNWGGLPLQAAAARRIDDLLARHGRVLYGSLEREAEGFLADGATLEELEARYPNAQLVATERVLAMEELLAQGEQRRVFEEARDMSVPELVSLRARAARAMGEITFAHVLEGNPAPATSALPALPGDAEGQLQVVLADRGTTYLHHATGQAAPEFAGVVLASLSGSGEFLLLDTRAGQVLWDSVRLPGRAREHSPALDFHFHGELLITRGKSTLQALRLADGGLVWERSLSGKIIDVAPVVGLWVSLSERSGRYLIEGFGMATGALAFRVDLPAVEGVTMVAVGDQLVCLTSGMYERSGAVRDMRLLVIDPLRGAVVSSTVVADDLSIANTVSDPDVVLLSGMSGAGSRLLGFDPRRAEVVWDTRINVDLREKMLFPSGAGRLVLRVPRQARGADGMQRTWDEIVSIDATTGPPQSAVELPQFSVIDPSAQFAPRVVLANPAETRQLQVLDGRDPSEGYSLELPSALSLSETTLHHGRDGFVLVSSPYQSPVATVTVVRGERGTDFYTVQVEEGGGYQVEVVEGAVVLAQGGVLRILRSSLP